MNQRSDKPKGGRPTIFTQELADEICRRMIEDGRSLRSVCRDDDMPAKGTVLRWAAENEKFRDQYAMARELLMEYWADDIVEISDDGTNDYVEQQRKDGSKHVVLDKEAVMRSTLRVNTRKWLMSKLAPRRYGTRLVAEHVGAGGGPIKYQRIERRIVDPTTDKSDDNEQ